MGIKIVEEAQQLAYWHGQTSTQTGREAEVQRLAAPLKINTNFYCRKYFICFKGLF